MIVDRRYRIDREIGRGAFATVYLATDTKKPGPPLALKIHHSGLLDATSSDEIEKALAKMKEEFRLLTPLKHPGLEEVYDLGLDRETGRAYFTAEFVDGKDFFRATEGASPEDILLLALQILDALAFIHEHGVVHGDLKPENVLVRRDVLDESGAPVVKLLDFGLARNRRASTPDSAARGTLAYASPEAMTGRGVDDRSDLYALGLLLHQALTRRLPTPQAAFGSREYWREIESEVRARSADMPEPFATLLPRLVAEDPAARWSSAREVLDLARLEARDTGPETASLRIPPKVPFVGRREELAVMRRLYEPVIRREPGPRVLLILGEPGIGKARLLEEFKHHCQLREGEFVEVDAGALGATAFSAVRDLARRLLGTLDASLASAHRSRQTALGLSAEPQAASLSRPEFRGAFMRFLRDVAAERPRTLVVRNADALDEASLDVLGHAAWRLAVEGEKGSTPLLLVFSLDPAGALRERASDLGAEGKAVEIHLRGLAPAESRELLEAFLGGASAIVERSEFDRLAQELHRDARGNPLFLRESLSAIAESGRLAFENGKWRARRAGRRDVEIPRATSVLLEARYRALEPPEAALLDVLAIGSSPLHLATIASTLGLREARVAAQARRLVRAGLAVEGSDAGTFGVTHPLLQTVVARLLPEARTRELHGKLGSALSDPSTAAALERTAASARHLLEGPDPTRGIELALSAADERLSRGETELAVDLYARSVSTAERTGARVPAPVRERFASAALQVGRFAEAAQALEAALLEEDGGLRDPSRRADLLLRLGEAKQRRGDFDSALGAYREAVEISAKSGQPTDEALARNALGYLHSLAGRYEPALSEATAGLARVEGERTRGRALLLNLKGVCELRLGRLEEATTSCRASLSLFEELNDSRGQSLALNNLGIIHDRRGEIPLALESYRGAARLYERSGNVADLAATLNNIGTVHLLQGHVEAAREQFEKSLAIREEIGDRYGVATAIANLGTVAREEGRFTEALERYDRSLEQYRRVGSPREEAILGIHRAELLLGLGDSASAKTELASAAKLAKTHGLATEAARVMWLRARLDLSEKPPRKASAARKDLASAAQSFREMGDARLCCEVLLTVAEFDLEKGRIAEARESASEARRLAENLRHGDLSARAAIAYAQAIEDPDARLKLLAFAGERTLASSRLFVRARLCAALLSEYRRVGDAKAAAEWLKRTEESFGRLRLGVPGDRRPAFDATPAVASIERALKAARDSPPSPAEAERRADDGGRHDRDQLATLLEINKRLNSEDDFDRLLEFIIDSAVHLTNAERGFLVLVSDGELSFRVARNFNMRDVHRPEFAVSRSILNDVISSGRPVISSNAQADERFRAFVSVSDLKLSSVLCTPFKARDTVLGAVYLDNRFERGLFSEADLELLKAFADQAAIAMGNLRRAAEIAALNLRLAERVELQAAELEGVRVERERDREHLKKRHGDIVGRSRKMHEVFRLIERLAPSDIPVLILGESGTGKELVAKAIHAGSARRDRVFLSENCSSIPTALLESELFGYAKGAFTGASQDKKGLFELAHRGTIFLDEIGDMPAEMQMKLLRVLQEKEFRPLGAKEVRHVDVRLISATNRDLGRLGGEGGFRSDLYYRIAGATVVLPPLRQRDQDVPLLLDHFLEKFGRESGMPRELTPAARRSLLAWRWPGNVRELENEVRRIVAIGDRVIDVGVLSPAIRESDADSTSAGGGESGGEPPIKSLEQLEKEAIEAALRRFGGNKPEAARHLGISLASIYVKLKRYGLSGK